MLNVNIKKYGAEIIATFIWIVLSIVLICIEITPTKLISVKDSFSLAVQIVTGITGLYFTAFTIFVGLGLSPSKLNFEEIREKIKKGGATDDEATEFIKTKIVKPYEENLTQATNNFKETIRIIILLLVVNLLAYSAIILLIDNTYSCSVNCTKLSFTFSYTFSIVSTVLTFYLVYDSAKFLANIRKLIK